MQLFLPAGLRWIDGEESYEFIRVLWTRRLLLPDRVPKRPLTGPFHQKQSSCYSRPRWPDNPSLVPVIYGGLTQLYGYPASFAFGILVTLPAVAVMFMLPKGSNCVQDETRITSVARCHALRRAHHVGTQIGFSVLDATTARSASSTCVKVSSISDSVCANEMEHCLTGTGKK